jgi:hypothetical protein
MLRTSARARLRAKCFGEVLASLKRHIAPPKRQQLAFAATGLQRRENQCP